MVPLQPSQSRIFRLSQPMGMGIVAGPRRLTPQLSLGAGIEQGWVDSD